MGFAMHPEPKRILEVVLGYDDGYSKKVTHIALYYPGRIVDYMFSSRSMMSHIVKSEDFDDTMVEIRKYHEVYPPVIS